MEQKVKSFFVVNVLRRVNEKLLMRDLKGWRLNGDEKASVEQIPESRLSRNKTSVESESFVLIDSDSETV